MRLALLAPRVADLVQVRVTAAFAKFQIAFYADPVDAVFKALGVE